MLARMCVGGLHCAGQEAVCSLSKGDQHCLRCNRSHFEKTKQTKAFARRDNPRDARAGGAEGQERAAKALANVKETSTRAS